MVVPGPPGAGLPARPGVRSALRAPGGRPPVARRAAALPGGLPPGDWHGWRILEPAQAAAPRRLARARSHLAHPEANRGVIRSIIGGTCTSLKTRFLQWMKAFA